MKLHVKIVDFFLNSSIWVACTVCALAEITCVNFEFKASNNLVEFVFFGTIFGYNFIKYFEKKHLSVLHLSLLKVDLKTTIEKFESLRIQEKITFLMSVFSAAVCGVLFFRLTIEGKLLLFFPTVLSFFYAISFKEKTLRSTSGIKIYVVGLVWALVTVVLPIIEAEKDIGYDVWLTFVQRIIFVVVLILPFEIRDLKVDDDSLRTLPQKIGVRKTKLLGVLFLLVFLFFEFFKKDLLETNLIVMPLAFIITLFFLLNSTVKQSKYYASFFVEGIPLLWLLLLLVL